ncbi:hypothetical protein M9H77_03182 [Catharanthus roseus]|uniref:Uncharacterized protein n=1 Tax=Catharanthus roseus TaxID=4058 RepID=A0ACC0CAP4_CATRO|nr:hypothetical protein M9H77_03182 [Catharanthus roseus]
MEVIDKQEKAYSKFANARSNCYKDGDYAGNAYEGSHHRDGHFTHKSQMGIGNFSSHAKAFDHIPYEECCENSLYDVHKGYHETKSCSFVLDLDRNSLQHACTLTLLSRRTHTMEFEGQGESVGGKLLLYYGDSSISLSSNLFLFYLVFSFKELTCSSMDGLLVPNKNSFVVSMKHEFSGTLLYHLPFKEFLKKFVCEEKSGKSWDFENKQSYTFFDEFLDFMSKSSWKKDLSNFVLDNLYIFNSILGLYVDNILELSFGFASPCELKSSWSFKKDFD